MSGTVKTIVMKKSTTLAFALFALACATANAQGTIKGLADAEKAFAAYTESHNIRDGFLRYLDSSALIFIKGIPTPAHPHFEKQKAGPAVLSWYPTFAIISAAGDMGVTTGPFQVRARSIADTPVGRGQFSSVWKLNSAGEWKNIIDLGIEYRKKTNDLQQVNEIALVQKNQPAATLSTLLGLDNKFNSALQEKNAGEVLRMLSADTWLNAEGETPIHGAELIGNVLLHMPDTVKLSPIAGGVSLSHDLAYVYGSVTNGPRKENYLRVWARRNNQWQVVLQTIKW